MQSYQCPNCGRVYNYGSESVNLITNCMNCRYPLKRIEDVKQVNHPELNEHKVVGVINDPTKPIPKCTYCGSTNVRKITVANKAIHTSIFGIWSMGRNAKNYHCNNCGSDF